jgi:hypothetical protein
MFIGVSKDFSFLALLNSDKWVKLIIFLKIRQTGVRIKKSSLKLLSQMNQNLVGSTFGRFCIKFPQSRMKGEQHRLSPLSL